MATDAEKSELESHLAVCAYKQEYESLMASMREDTYTSRTDDDVELWPKLFQPTMTPTKKPSKGSGIPEHAPKSRYEAPEALFAR